MGEILLTGISGNVGKSVLDYLVVKNVDFVAGVRNLDKYKRKDTLYNLVEFDFENESTYDNALKGIKKVFLIRPPQLTDVEGIFKPFIDRCKEKRINHIVFLSLLGVEKNPFPPHHKIEKLILKSGIDYTFIRPSFFMQNISTTHAEDIRDRNDIFIPSGKAKVSFIDTRDIGEIVGRTLIEEGHRNKAYTLTGPEAIDYYKVAEIMSIVLERDIIYSNPGLLKFRKEMVRRGIKKEFATVMTILYMTTKLGLADQVTDTAEKLLGRKPISIEDFIIDYRNVWN